MATNHTTNYGLNLWEPGDDFLRAEFNENSQKLDAALKAEMDARSSGDAALQAAVNTKADASALNALTQTVAAKGNCTIITGSYTGTGEYGPQHPVVLDFADTVGKPPLLVFVAAANAQTCLLVCRDMTNQHTSTSSVARDNSYDYISWSETGVSWYNSKYASYHMNEENVVYHYVVLF